MVGGKSIIRFCYPHVVADHMEPLPIILAKRPEGAKIVFSL